MPEVRVCVEGCACGGRHQALDRKSVRERLLKAAASLLKLIEKTAAAGSYYYEEVEQKRWILGPGGKSGNCEICVENEERGWIDMDAVYEGVFGDIDEAPAHPNCECETEFKTRRQRVYEDDDD